jgi:hypothetical protein
MVETTFLAWRVYRAKHRYDQASAYSTVKKFEVDDATNVTVSIGDVPVECVQAYSVQDGVLEMLLSGQTADGPRIVQVPDEWQADGELFTSIEVAQVRELGTTDAMKDKPYFWYANLAAEVACQEFGLHARRLMDEVTAVLTGHFSQEELLDAQIYESRVAIRADGKPLQPVPVFRVGSVRATVTKTMEEDLGPRLQGIELPITRDKHESCEAIGRWVSRSLSEPDGFKRFVWAFAGLEVLCRKASGLYRADVLGRVSTDSNLDASVVAELLWPAGMDDVRDPARNLAFGFTLMSVALSPETSSRDVAKFKEIQTFRNRIHGRRIDEQQAMALSADTIDLLRRYAPSIVKSIL